MHNVKNKHQFKEAPTLSESSTMRLQNMTDATLRESPDMPARDWMRILSNYREPIHWRSIWEIGVTAVPFVAFLSLAWMFWGISPG